MDIYFKGTLKSLICATEDFKYNDYRDEKVFDILLKCHK